MSLLPLPHSPVSQTVPRAEVAFLFLAGLFLVSLVVANLITAKLFTLFGVVLTAGIIPYPITFLSTDIICEVYGKRRATILVFAGFLFSFYVLILIKLGQYAIPFEGLNRQQEYVTIFGNSARAILASMVAYLAAQYCDVYLFHFWKDFTNGKHLWLRNNGSTMVSQMIDTVLVVTILFYGQMPNSQLVALIFASYGFKCVIAAADTPFFYFAARYLERYVTTGISWRDTPLWRDLWLLTGCLCNVALLVGGALYWRPAAPGTALPAVGMAICAIGSVSHLLATVAFAKPHRARVCALAMATLGAIAFWLALRHGGAGTAGMTTGMAAAILILCGLLARGTGRFHA